MTLSRSPAVADDGGAMLDDMTTFHYEIVRFAVSRRVAEWATSQLRGPESHTARMHVEVQRNVIDAATDIIVSMWVPQRTLVAREVRCGAEVDTFAHTYEPDGWREHLRADVLKRWPWLRRWLREPRLRAVRTRIRGQFPGTARVDVVYLLDPSLLERVGGHPLDRPRLTSIRMGEVTEFEP